MKDSNDNNAEKGCETTLSFLKHIFGDYYELGLDYIQLLITRPEEALPLLLLFSEENQTGKSTFLFFLKHLFGPDMEIVSHRDLLGGFVPEWQHKSIIGCEETTVADNRVLTNMRKMSFGRQIVVNQPGQEVCYPSVSLRFVLCSNDAESTRELMEKETQIFFVEVPTIPCLKSYDLSDRLFDESKDFLEMLGSRKLSVPEKEGRFWFKHERFNLKKKKAEKASKKRPDPKVKSTSKLTSSIKIEMKSNGGFVIESNGPVSFSQWHNLYEIVTSEKE